MFITQLNVSDNQMDTIWLFCTGYGHSTNTNFKLM